MFSTYPGQVVVDHPISVPIEHRFDPYVDNGGTLLSIAGEDFCVVAADTRQSEGYSINSRYVPKSVKLSDKTVISMGGCYADCLTLTKRIQQSMEWYQHAHGKTMSTAAVAQMLSIMLYQKRFFPFYSWCILGGLDEEGKGAVYTYDPVGSYERETCRCAGSASALIQPFLDNQINFKNQETQKHTQSLEKVLRITKDSFTSATERDIYTGDYLEIFVITSKGVEVQKMDLKKD
ncbi:Proteasome subunit beta type-1 [Dissophora globulifera]|uniref:Proteasome subunit beta n=1 Tax=Dissophora globulifera TaxID=979702 RepID=A0A9P6RUE7_9FUNG|nr:Proteasome subunit beta type-1 [Dissophora globulifera]KAG0330145.1 Proteasome subunit beta type-1 [Dissophora globulifera]